MAGVTPADLRRLQTAVDDIVGAHLRVTTATAYPVDLSDHALVLGPGAAAAAEP